MHECIISNIPVIFPFEPYDVQKNFMTKVIQCLETGTNGILESPTGTGKTLSLLCSTLAWILIKKSQAQIKVEPKLNDGRKGNKTVEIPKWIVPKVIYASRTHSQLSQAMQELKRTAYSFMRAVVLGSRDQLCIHPEVSKEPTNAAKTQMCKIKNQTRSCFFFNRIEARKDSPEFRVQPIMDIEDLVQVCQKLKMCPYYGARELIEDADITFMPYNYLLDPKARKTNKIELSNTVVILDEAHNVEKMCEESASVQLKSTDIALCIDDTTQIMKIFTEGSQVEGDGPTDFTLDDLILLKEMFLELEKAIDGIEVTNLNDGVTFPGSYMFEILGKINANNFPILIKLLDNLIQFLAMDAQKNSFFRRGIGYENLVDLLTIAFSDMSENHAERAKRSFKVHVSIEETKSAKQPAKKDGWLSAKSTGNTKSQGKVINYWCFNPGFGMAQLLNKKVHCIILTSGTLAPLKPLIAELGIPISHRLENPHIVSKSQVCVKIVPCGPDKEPLMSNYKNRDNIKYIMSLGRTINAFCPVVPHGMLVFFPSYPIMNKCIEEWQSSGIWSQICRLKPVFVEPKNKDAFGTTMNEFYANINDPKVKGACFMAVCRGKVSEGLDFADINGRAVLITGLPYPPLKDPRVILKKQYLEENRTKENELLSGDNWYSLEAIRAVNQAIGRVIRHKNDYGAILLCDLRFNYSSQKSQLSAWVQSHLSSSQQYPTFGPIIGEISRFFRNAERTLPQSILKVITPNCLLSEGLNKSAIISSVPEKLENKKRIQTESTIKIEYSNAVSDWTPSDYAATKINSVVDGIDFMSRLDETVTTINFNDCNKADKIEEIERSQPLVTIHKRERSSPLSEKLSLNNKRKKLKLVPNISPIINTTPSTSKIDITSPSSMANYHKEEKIVPYNRSELLKLIKNSVSSNMYSIFVKALMSYQRDDKFDDLFTALTTVFKHSSLHYLLKGMRRFIKEIHKLNFDEQLLKFFEK